jgi:hypothetical protein
MSDDTIAETNCALCHDLDPVHRSAMRADLIVIPLRDIEHICDPCMEAFTANLFAGFPKTEEEKMRRREEMSVIPSENSGGLAALTPRPL